MQRGKNGKCNVGLERTSFVLINEDIISIQLHMAYQHTAVKQLAYAEILLFY